MQRRLFAVVAAMLVCVFATSAPARYRAQPDANGNLAGVVTSKKTGATARVGAQYAAKFQAYIDDLEAQGAVIRFMGGIRRGKCWSGGMHPCGKALDVCQTARDRVDPRCHLPSRHELARIASAHGLFEGGQWCRGDMGHVQAGVSAAPCGAGGTMIARRHRGTVTASARAHRMQRAQVAEFKPADRLTSSY
jgi:hypothetical protein